jgi:hypothetical protein
VLVNNCFETSVPGVYAIGDCAQYRTPPPGRKAVEQVLVHGPDARRNAGPDADREADALRPRPLVQLAKFLDIEYQTYGQVGNTLGENEATFYWEHPDGRKSLRVNYHPHSRQVLGFNAFGIRLRHEVCDRWLTEKRPVGIRDEPPARGKLRPRVLPAARSRNRRLPSRGAGIKPQTHSWPRPPADRCFCSRQPTG